MARSVCSNGHGRPQGMETCNVCHPVCMSPSGNCVFCAIAGGEESAAVVLRDERVCAFLDARPVFKGHVLVVPAAHTPDLAALAEADLAPLFGAARRVA